MRPQPLPPTELRTPQSIPIVAVCIHAELIFYVQQTKIKKSSGFYVIIVFTDLFSDDDKE